MQPFLWRTLVITFFAFAIAAKNTCKPVKPFTGKTEKASNDAGSTASRLHAKNPAAIKTSIAIKNSGFTIVHFAPGKNKNVVHAAGVNKRTAGPADLTLDYFAVQLSRSYAF